MKRAPEWRGMVWPDVYVTKFFFKTGLNQRVGSLLELGGGNGNNARLFAEYGWHVTELDFDPRQIADATVNWDQEDPSTFDFRQWDLRQGLPELERRFDVIVGNGSLFYFERSYLESLLDEARTVMAPYALAYFRFRTTDDWRFGKGEQLERNTFRIDVTETGEHGSTMVFFEPDEIVHLIDAHLGPLKDKVVLLDRHENLQHGVVVDNRDIVVWGRL